MMTYKNICLFIRHTNYEGHDRPEGSSIICSESQESDHIRIYTAILVISKPSLLKWTHTFNFTIKP